MSCMMFIASILLGFSFSFIHGAEEQKRLLPTDLYEAALKEVIRMSSRHEQTGEMLFESVFEESEEDFTREKAGRKVDGMTKGLPMQPLLDCFESIMPAEASGGAGELQVKSSSVPKPKYSIILYNTNVPIEALTIVEKNHIMHFGKPRSCLRCLSDRAIWDIDLCYETCPFILQIIANGKIYKWLIPSVGPGYGNELALIQRTVPGGFILMLKQMEELAVNYLQRTIPLLS